MITSENFITNLKAYKEGCDFLRKMDNYNLDFYETPLSKSSDTMFQAWLDQITNEEGQDLIYWWLFEDVDKIITDNEVDINVEDIEEFTKYLKDYGYFKN
jgi:hypothetical protein